MSGPIDRSRRRGAFRDDTRVAGPRAAAIGLAVLIHLAILSSAGSEVTRTAPPPRVTEIELAAPPPPPPPPPSPPEPPKTAPAPESKPAAPVKAAPRAEPARPARVLTAAEPTGTEPVDFATDPQGNPFAAQVVASGATAAGPIEPAPPTEPSRPAPRDRIAPPEDLAAAARLEESDPCSGFYPRGAAVDRGEAVLSVVVRSNGRALSAAVVTESPPGQGFGPSARRCLIGKRFTPARDRSGRTVAAAATIRVRFSR